MEFGARGQKVARFGLYEADVRLRVLTKGGLKVRLQDQPFQVLALLLERPGELVTREEIQHKLWPADTYVAFDDGLNTAIKKLRSALSDTADNPRFIETVPRRGYRFVAPVNILPESQLATGNQRQAELPSSFQMPETSAVGATPVAAERLRPGRVRYVWLAFGGLLLAGAIAAYLHLRAPSFHVTPSDTIVLADFVNTTGETVFDNALREATEVGLQQSPYLNIVPDRKTAAILTEMRRGPDDHVTGNVAIEVCQRAGGKVTVQGSISSIGTTYLVGLAAIRCDNGTPIAREEVDARRKEDVVDALGKATSRLRARLGESMPSIQKYDVRLVRATTPSLDALRAYGQALSTLEKSGDLAAVPFFKRAIELDPNFALAYAGLSVRYNNLGQTSLAREYATKAYGLRDRVTELEKLRISTTYFYVTGQLQKELQDYDLWIANYPRDRLPHRNRGVTYCFIGQWEKALLEFQQAMRLAPDSVVGDYASLGSTYIALNRLGEAKTTLDQALAHQLDDESLRVSMYYLGFLQGDVTQMEQQVAWGVGQAGSEDALLSVQSDTEAFNGRLNKARELSRKAVDSAIRADAKETAAYWRVNAALREAELGDAATAKEGITEALTSSSGRDVQLMSALALARMGDTPRAAALVKALEKSYATDTILKFYWLPAINSAIELNKGNSSQALMYLKAAAPYQLGNPPPMQIGTLYPVYLRGQAYLLAHDGSAAAAEFQKFLDHRGIVLNFATGALVHLQLGRAYAMTGDTAKAKTAYQDFLTLWKGADPDIPVLKQAKAEYAALR